MQVEIIPAVALHIEQIAKNTRKPDRDELWAMSLCKPEDAMRLGLLYSDKALTGMIDGEPVCMWGVTTVSLYGGVGSPWMVGTDKLDRHAATFLRRCGRQVKELFAEYRRLENFVDARNTRAIKWLKWLGFSVDDKTKPHGALGLPFHRFVMEG